MERASAAVLKGKEGMAELADLFKSLPAAQALELGKKLGLDDKTIATLREGSQALKENEQTVRALGLALDEVDQKNLKEFGARWERATGIAGAAMLKLGAQFAGAVNDMFKLPITELLRNAVSGIGGVLKEVFVDSWVAIGKDLATAFMTYVYNPLQAWVTTAFLNAWEWIKDMFSSATSGLTSIMDTITSSITKWVTTPVANAWQWIKDTFWAGSDKFQLAVGAERGPGGGGRR